jgi:aldehyde:ferredoxin oxidoreductase
MEINKLVSANIKERPPAKAIGGFGTGVSTAASLMSGDSPVKNWGGAGGVDFGTEEVQRITSFAMDEKYKTKRYACSTCPLGCGAEYEVNEGRWPVGKTERPEYETASVFGSSMLNIEPDVIIKCNEICNRYGLDTISAGGTIAWAMECYNEGVLSKEDLDGIDLKWGNGEAIVAFLQKMGDAEGCGKIFANGSAYASRHFGKGEEYLQTASNMELAMHDPRWAPGMARIYKYDPTPGRHTKGGIGQLQMHGAIPDKYNYIGTGELDVRATCDTEMTDCAGFCMLDGLGFPPDGTRAYLEAITGLDFSDEVTLNTGLRIWYIRAAFNLREGIKPSNMPISNRVIGAPPLPAGPTEGITVDIDQLAQNFFETAGIDFETGKPTLAMLKQVGHLEEVIKDLYGEA